MELTERIADRVDELTGEVELLRKQLADAERELERLVSRAGQVGMTSMGRQRRGSGAGSPLLLQSR
jgi:hypothetical protein